MNALLAATDRTRLRNGRCAVTAAAAVLLLAAALWPGAARAQGQTVRVEVTGFRSGSGKLLCALFADGARFPASEGAAQRVVADVTLPVSACVFTEVKPGRYAVAVVHDENGNGKLDRVPLLGIPTEGYGVSGNKTHAMGPPVFEECAFDFDGQAGRVVSVTLRN